MPSSILNKNKRSERSQYQFSQMLIGRWKSGIDENCNCPKRSAANISFYLVTKELILVKQFSMNIALDVVMLGAESSSLPVVSLMMPAIVIARRAEFM